MTIPDYQSPMQPVLTAFAQGEARIGAVVEILSSGEWTSSTTEART
jgi:hypothetical protein